MGYVCVHGFRFGGRWYFCYFIRQDLLQWNGLVNVKRKGNEHSIRWLWQPLEGGLGGVLWRFSGVFLLRGLMRDRLGERGLIGEGQLCSFIIPRPSRCFRPHGTSASCSKGWPQIMHFKQRTIRKRQKSEVRNHPSWTPGGYPVQLGKEDGECKVRTWEGEKRRGWDEKLGRERDMEIAYSVNGVPIRLTYER